jgi:hypothetical protein
VTAETIRRIWEGTEEKNVNHFTVRYLTFLAQYCTDDKIRENEAGGTCNTYGGEEKCVQNFCGKN